MANTAPVPNIRPAMNPAIVVAGGGGDGGGAGGGSGGSGSKGMGASTGKGNQNPEDGSKSGADCGAGGNGGCTGCSSQIAKGDPVDVATGEVFTIPVTDLALPGYFDFELVRSYSSRDRDLDRGLGYGWAHSLDWELRREGDLLFVTSGEGHEEEFVAPEPGKSTEEGPWIISAEEGGYALRAGNEFVHHFVADETDNEHFMLAKVTHPSRGELGLFYENGRLARVVDTVGRTITFARDRQGRVISIDVPPPEGRTRCFARFRYDEEGNLVETLDADSRSTTYSYDADHRLIQYRYATGLTFHFRYDREGRCVETWGDYPGGRDPALATNVSEYLADHETRAKGIYHIVIDYGPEGYREVTDSVRVQRFFTNELGLVDKGVDAFGNVTERAYDESGRVVGVTDRLGATTTYAYDERGNVTLERDAEGHVYRFEYDQNDNLIKLTDPAGNSVKETYVPSGELEHVEDLRGGTIFNHLGEHGLILAQATQNGGRTDYQYDGHANCVWRRDPNGSEWRFAYDWWGNQVEEHAPTGLVTKSQYSDAGKLLLTEDSLGHQERWEYDAMGNCVAHQTPDGQWTRYVYGGLRWLCVTAHPDGTSFETKYTREGWAIEYKNERGESYAVAHDPNALPDQEVTYDGRTIRAGYDAMSRMVWMEEDSLRTEYVRSPLGLVLAKTTKNGEQQFAYDVRGLMIAAQNGPVGFEWQRDRGGALVGEGLTIGDSNYQLTYGLDVAGRCVALQDPDGLGLEYTRDAASRVQAIHCKGRPIVGFERSPEGTPQRLRLPGDASIADALDALDRVQRRELVTPVREPDHDAPEWLRENNRGTFRAYHWDALDQLVEETSADGTTTYEYTARQFLKAKRVHGPAGTITAEVFQPDEMGRPYESREDGGPVGAGVGAVGVGAVGVGAVGVGAAGVGAAGVGAAGVGLGAVGGLGGAGRIYGPGGLLERRGHVRYEYDGRHRMTAKRERLDGGAELVWRYEWDDWDMLSAVVTPRGLRAEYDYDAFARRMQKRILRLETEGADAGQYKLLWRTDYVWAKCSLLQELDFDAEGKRARTRTYLYEELGDTIALGHRDDDGEWRYYFADPNGTPELIVDARGQILGRLQRTAYGRTTVVDGSTESTQLRFPGQYEDPETGLHYNRFRYYDPDTGRYLSPDPIGFDGGHDLFGYGPNPIGYYDPMGWARKRRKTNAGAKSGGKGIKSETQDQTPGELQSTEKSPLDRKTPPEDAVEAAEVATEGTYPACKCCGKGGSRKRKKKRKKKYPGKTKPRPPARAKTEPSNRERRIAARPGNSPRQRAAREKVVRDFMAKKGLGSKHADDALGVHPVTGEANKHPDGYGIDISKPVKVVTLPPPKQVSQHVSSNHGNPGNYFDGKGGQTPDELGIRGDNRHSRTFDVPDKDPKIEALQSANGPVVDRWTRDPSGKPYPPKKTPGGGEQLTIGNDDIKSFACSFCHQSPPYKPPCTCPNP